jgi:hypothetical protein
MPDETRGIGGTGGTGGTGGGRGAGGKGFGDEQVNVILRRAMELQKADPADAGGDVVPEFRMTLADLEQLARDVGIDPRHIRSAALEVSHGVSEQPERFRLAGGPSHFEIDGVAAGTVTPQQWESIVKALRSTFGGMGRAGQLGSSLEWTHSNNDLIHEVATFSPRPPSGGEGKGETEITLMSRQDGLMVVSYLGGSLFALIALGVTMGVAKSLGLPAGEGAVIAVAGMGGVLATTRALLARWTRRRRAQLREAMERLRGMIEEGAGTGGGET